jgi:hypothetical protein
VSRHVHSYLQRYDYDYGHGLLKTGYPTEVTLLLITSKILLGEMFAYHLSVFLRFFTNIKFLYFVHV